MNCPQCDARTEPFDVNRLPRPCDPCVFRRAVEARECPACGWRCPRHDEVRFALLLEDFCHEQSEQNGSQDDFFRLMDC